MQTRAQSRHIALLCLLLCHHCSHLSSARADHDSQAQQPPHVLYINLARSQARRAHMTAWLSDKNLFPGQFTRIEALDASTFAFQDMQSGMTLRVQAPSQASPPSNRDPFPATGIGDSEPLPCLDLLMWAFDARHRRSAVGCGLSHLKAIAVAYAMGLEEVLIMEDDVAMIGLVSDDIAHAKDNAAAGWAYLRAMIDSLPEDWTLLQVSSLIFSKPKIADMEAAVTLRNVLWSRRDSCAARDYTVWGMGAYVVSRRGMRAVLRRHLSTVMLTAATLGDGSFCARADLRGSAVTVTSDTLLFDMRGVYLSHVPLLLPCDALARASTVQAAGPSVLMAEHRAAVAASIAALRRRTTTASRGGIIAYGE
eukprot:TRINITY_DN1965_c0_g1_i3.p1 TRINITY_DN1965_c0_g1~~TRINITY_DN1965_c0_g1_i3.p1  ORF type:complete len:366 (-),score=75.37 TRINITY_DN1965_c0_g1_i3:803-1900(-)